MRGTNTKGLKVRVYLFAWPCSFVENSVLKEFKNEKLNPFLSSTTVFFPGKSFKQHYRKDSTTKLYKCYLAIILNEVKMKLMKMNHFFRISNRC